MARPLRKGPPIGFRLPIEHHTLLEQLAAARGETANAYVERVIIASLQRRLVGPEPAFSPPPRPAPAGKSASEDVYPTITIGSLRMEPAGCKHPVWIGDGDERTCKHCGVKWPG